jgi:hypothetical protein
MLAALALVAVTMATLEIVAPAPRLPWTPTSITLSVHAAPGVPAAVTRLALEEAAAIWRGVGLTLHWTIDDRAGAAGAIPVPDEECALRVIVDDAPPPASGTMMPLGWIGFDANDPTEEIHLSFSNALALMQDVRGAGEAFRLTQMERNILLSRAVGRALAHELGHYLLGSRDHTRTGLMQTARPATDFFEPGSDRFAIAPAQQRLIASRWVKVSMAATNQ